MSFKLKTVHIFLALLVILFVSNLGVSVKEYFENKAEEHSPTSYNESSTNQPSTASSGISRSDIPQDNEDLYILKSEIVPPVCPKCPDVVACPKQQKCQPCPPCGRCPEPAFTCKKVPNYQARGGDYLPRPVLNDFSQFGM